MDTAGAYRWPTETAIVIKIYSNGFLCIASFQLALSSFFETEGANIVSNPVDDDEDEAGAAALPSSFSYVSIPPKVAKKEKKSMPQGAGGARIMTLSNLDSSSDDDDEHSGQVSCGNAE